MKKEKENQNNDISSKKQTNCTENRRREQNRKRKEMNDINVIYKYRERERDSQEFARGSATQHHTGTHHTVEKPNKETKQDAQEWTNTWNQKKQTNKHQYNILPAMGILPVVRATSQACP
jgi:exosome complex RNA-binding protein Rrp42 (RNase PH superfamily)